MFLAYIAHQWPSVGGITRAFDIERCDGSDPWIYDIGIGDCDGDNVPSECVWMVPGTVED